MSLLEDYQKSNFQIFPLFSFTGTVVTRTNREHEFPYQGHRQQLKPDRGTKLFYNIKKQNNGWTLIEFNVLKFILDFKAPRLKAIVKCVFVTES